MLRSLSIREKLLILLFSLCSPLLVFVFLWYEKSSETIEINATDFSDVIVKQINGHLDLYFKDIERLTLPLLAHKLTLNFLNTTTDDPYTRMLITNPIVDQIFPAIMLNRPDIFGVSLVSNQSAASSSFSFISAQERYQTYISKVREVGRYQIMGLNNFNGTMVVTQALRYLNTSSGKTTGMIILDIRLDEIAKICQNTKLGDSGFIWIADPDGQIIYHPQNEKIGTKIPQALKAKLFSQDSGTFVERTSSGKLLVIFHRSELTNLTLVSEVKMNELSGPLIRIRNISIIIGVLFLILALVVVGTISLPYTNSILLLQRLMKRAAIGDLSVRAPDTKRNEMGSLFHSFNNMVTEIRRLIEVVHLAKLREKEMEVKQKESILQAMQSKINPHFLYNTLELINSYAIVEGIMPISRMATSLADFFRYSVGNPAMVVTLKDEITHIQTYLGIQKERYENLSVHINIDEELISSIKAIRLMLQPIVENAFKHGYQANKLRPDYIAIHDDKIEGDYYLYVSDKGNGMAQKLMETYNAAFRQSESIEEQDFDHIGLWNVHERIRLVFGTPYGLYIEQSGEAGTTIRIRLPMSETSGGDTDV